MIFSLERLEEAIAKDKLSPVQKAQYLIVLQVMGALLAIPSYIVSPFFKNKPPLSIQTISLFNYVLAGFIIYKGLRKCFSINKSIDNKSFIERVTILSVPITIKIFIFSYCLFFYIGYLFRNDITNPYYFLLLKFMNPFCAFLYIILLLKSVVRVGKNKDKLDCTEEIKNSEK